jgi:hypothetical protein
VNDAVETLDDAAAGYLVVTGAATSADASYAGLDAPDVAAENLDPDVASLVIVAQRRDDDQAVTFAADRDADTEPQRDEEPAREIVLGAAALAVIDEFVASYGSSGTSSTASQAATASLDAEASAITGPLSADAFSQEFEVPQQLVVRAPVDPLTRFVARGPVPSAIGATAMIAPQRAAGAAIAALAINDRLGGDSFSESAVAAITEALAGTSAEWEAAVDGETVAILAAELAFAAGCAAYAAWSWRGGYLLGMAVGAAPFACDADPLVLIEALARDRRQLAADHEGDESLQSLVRCQRAVARHMDGKER